MLIYLTIKRKTNFSYAMYLKMLLTNSFLHKYKQGCRHGSNSCEISKTSCKYVSLSIYYNINLLVKLSVFPEECKIAKVKLLFKEGSKTDPKRPIPLLNQFIIRQKIILKRMAHSTNISQVLEQSFQLIHVYHS